MTTGTRKASPAMPPPWSRKRPQRPQTKKSGPDPRDHQALPWAGHTVYDAKAWVERRIQNAGDSVWLSLSGEENHYYWWYYYDDDDNSLVPNPMMKFYRSNGQPLVMNGDTIEDTLGSGTRRFNLPRLRLIPDADDTYYMRVSSTSNGTGKFWVYFGDSSITSSRGDRNNSDCHSGRTHANANCTLLEPTSRASLSGQT